MTNEQLIVILRAIKDKIERELMIIPEATSKEGLQKICDEISRDIIDLRLPNTKNI